MQGHVAVIGGQRWREGEMGMTLTIGFFMLFILRGLSVSSEQRVSISGR